MRTEQTEVVITGAGPSGAVAAGLLRKHGHQVLRRGVEAFRAFVESWSSGGFQKIIFHPALQPDVRRKLCSILAGDVWNRGNPDVARPGRRAALEPLCAQA